MTLYEGKKLTSQLLNSSFPLYVFNKNPTCLSCGRGEALTRGRHGEELAEVFLAAERVK